MSAPAPVVEDRPVLPRASPPRDGSRTPRHADGGAAGAGRIAPGSGVSAPSPGAARVLPVRVFPRGVYNKLYGRIRRWIPHGATERERAVWNNRGLTRVEGKPLDSNQMSILRSFVASHDDLDDEMSALATSLLMGEVREPRHQSRSHSCARTSHLWTYNGPWGVIPLALLPPLVCPVDVDDLAIRIRATPWWAQFRSELVPALSRVVASLHASMWAWSVEICPTGCAAQPPTVRLHVHFAFVGARNVVHVGPEVMCLGSCPVVSQMSLLGSGGRCPHAPLFYCSAPKIGQVASDTSHRPFCDYAVRSTWVVTLLEAQKVSIHSARALAISCSCNIVMLLQTLDRIASERADASIAQHARDVRLRLNSQARPWRHVPEIAAWLNEFNTESLRYRFLVLVGGSMLGKTEYARCVLHPDACLLVDCGGCVEPDLRAHRPLQHHCIVMDECRVQTVLRNRRLFMAPASWIRLGQSSTNCHAYDVWIHRNRIIITSNSWDREIQAVTFDERCWLEANSVVVHLNQPLWV